MRRYITKPPYPPYPVMVLSNNLWCIPWFRSLKNSERIGPRKKMSNGTITCEEEWRVDKNLRDRRILFEAWQITTSVTKYNRQFIWHKWSQISQRKLYRGILPWMKAKILMPNQMANGGHTNNLTQPWDHLTQLVPQHFENEHHIVIVFFSNTRRCTGPTYPVQVQKFEFDDPPATSAAQNQPGFQPFFWHIGTEQFHNNWLMMGCASVRDAMP